MRLGRAIKIARAEQGLKQAELAATLEVSANYVSLLENDKRDPSWGFVCRLAEALNTPLPLLLMLASDDRDTASSTLLRTRIATELLGLLSQVESNANTDRS